MSADGERCVSIYALCDPENGTPRYVGLTCNRASYRVAAHIGTALAASHPTPKDTWLCGLHARQLRPTLVLLETVPRSAAMGAERRWISAYRAAGHALFNKHDGGNIGGKRGLSDVSVHEGRMIVRSQVSIHQLIIARTGDTLDISVWYGSSLRDRWQVNACDFASYFTPEVLDMT